MPAKTQYLYNILNESHFLLYQKEQTCTPSISADDSNEDYDVKALRVCHRLSNKNDKQCILSPGIHIHV